MTSGAEEKLGIRNENAKVQERLGDCPERSERKGAAICEGESIREERTFGRKEHSKSRTCGGRGHLGKEGIREVGHSGGAGIRGGEWRRGIFLNRKARACFVQNRAADVIRL